MSSSTKTRYSMWDGPGRLAQTASSIVIVTWVPHLLESTYWRFIRGVGKGAGFEGATRWKRYRTTA